MREVVVHAWTSLDGFSVDEGTEAMRVMNELEDPAGEERFARTLAGAGTHIMGRVTYLEMAEFWPKSPHVNAAPMNDIAKVVFSRTLRDTPWQPARIVSGETAGEVARLKAEPGGEIIAHGGTQFVRSLARLGLADRYRFYVIPFAAGGGVPLFTPDARPGRLELAGSTTWACGIVELDYRSVPAGGPSR